MRPRLGWLLAAALAGCTALAPGDVVRTPDGGARDGGANDGGPFDAAPPDANDTDGGDLDAGPPPDAGVDGGGEPIAVRWIIAGGQHACALTSPGDRLVCWGDNNALQLGVGVPTPVPPTVVAEGVADACAGSDFTCLASPDGEVTCLGANGAGQLGALSATERHSMTGPWMGVQDLTCGSQHACVLDSLSRLFCWGANGQRQIADVLPARLEPTRVTFSTPDAEVQAASAGALHTCASVSTTADGVNLFCWGSNAADQIDASRPDDVVATPTRIHSGAWRFDAGGTFTCAWDATDLVCRGADGAPDLDDPVVSAAPREAPSILAAGLGFACARFATETRCWGANPNGQLGTTAAGSSHPLALPPDDGAIVQLAAGQAHGCALTDGSAVHCWGLNENGQVSASGPSPAPPTLVPIAEALP